MTTSAIDFQAALKRSLEDRAPVAFPIASDYDRLLSFAYYRNARSAAMKSWIVQAFATLTAHPPTERLALLIAHELMVAETKRAPNQHESRLMGEVIRDLLCVRFIERDTHDARTRELEREVL